MNSIKKGKFEMEKIIDVRKKVYELLNNDDSGHSMDHIDRVLDLSLTNGKNTGGIGEVVNTLDCGSNMRGFDSHCPSHRKY